jgi:indole-3-glycerol phosphate synthase
MSRFLDEMAEASTRRVAAARRRLPLDELHSLVAAAPPVLPLRLSARGFDVIAEIKLRSPAAGVLGQATDDWRARAAEYASAGAAAVSVLTEPTRFDGSLEHLREVARVLSPLGVPAMRKDFLVDPYQVLEARAAGAGGVLVILRMLDRVRILELLDTAAEQRMFVLLEAFDAADLDLAAELLSRRPAARESVLVGVNSRDLQTLEVVPERFELLAPHLPLGWPCVAESGVGSGADALKMQGLGYRLALIGTALMLHDSPGVLLRDILDAARTVHRNVR